MVCIEYKATELVEENCEGLIETVFLVSSSTSVDEEKDESKEVEGDTEGQRDQMNIVYEYLDRIYQNIDGKEDDMGKEEEQLQKLLSTASTEFGVALVSNDEHTLYLVCLMSTSFVSHEVGEEGDQEAELNAKVYYDIMFLFLFLCHMLVFPFIYQNFSMMKFLIFLMTTMMIMMI